MGERGTKVGNFDLCVVYQQKRDEELSSSSPLFFANAAFVGTNCKREIGYLRNVRSFYKSLSKVGIVGGYRSFLV